MADSLLRVGLITGSAFLAAVAFARDAYAASTLLVVLTLMQGAAFHRRARAGARATLRAIEGIRHGEFPSPVQLGAESHEIEAALRASTEALRSSLSAAESELQAFRSIVALSPVPLVAIEADGRAQLLNMAGRRFFDRAAVPDIESFAEFGAELRDAVADLSTGAARLVKASIDGRPVRLAVSAASLKVKGVARRIVAIQNIESELGAAEFDAWRDLLRVLTHEIMNTLTPISSMSSTAAEVAARLEKRIGGSGTDPGTRADVAKLKDAVEAMNRRAESLQSFVKAYRKVATLPAPKRQLVNVSVLLEELARLFAPRLGAAGVELRCSTSDCLLSVNADRDQLSQALINLLTNAQEAIEESHRGGSVRISATATRNGHLKIEVSDDGPGVPAEARSHVFTPFFTTRASGVGIGLSLVRQIALAHGGSVSLEPQARGARFVLELP